MTELPVQQQKMLLDATLQYVDAQADARIKAGANDCLARVFSTVLGRHIFEDAIAQSSQIKSVNEGGTVEQATAQLEEWVFQHPLDKVVATFFDPKLETLFAGMFDSEAPQAAMERYRQFQKQLASTQAEVVTYFQQNGWADIVEAVCILDRRWFQYNHSIDGITVAEAKSNRLRRAALQSLEELKQLHRMFATPEGFEIGRAAAKRYQKRMKEKGIPFPQDDKSKPKPQGFG